MKQIHKKRHFSITKKISEILKINFVSAIFSAYILPLDKTLKFKKIYQKKYEGPAIYAIWHANQYVYLAEEHSSRHAFTLLISPSNDGDMIAKVCHQMNFSLIRGSTNRQGMLAVRDMIKAIRRGSSVAFTLDGPKGPVHIAKEGLIRLAKMAQVPIIPTMPATKHKFTFNSWDKYELPHWFSRSAVIYGEPIFVPKDSSDGDLENYRVIIENKMFELKSLAEEELKRK